MGSVKRSQLELLVTVCEETLDFFGSLAQCLEDIETRESIRKTVQEVRNILDNKELYNE